MVMELLVSSMALQELCEPSGVMRNNTGVFALKFGDFPCMLVRRKKRNGIPYGEDGRYVFV